MKNHLWIFFLILLLAMQSCQEKIDIENEKKAVIAVNQEERDAYFDRDLARLEAIWVQEPTSQRLFSNYAVNIYDNTALLYHDIRWTGKFQGRKIDDKANRIFHLVKTDGTWKIDLIIQLFVPSGIEDIEITVKPEDHFLRP